MDARATFHAPVTLAARGRISSYARHDEREYMSARATRPDGFSDRATAVALENYYRRSILVAEISSKGKTASRQRGFSVAADIERRKPAVFKERPRDAIRYYNINNMSRNHIGMLRAWVSDL